MVSFDTHEREIELAVERSRLENVSRLLMKVRYVRSRAKPFVISGTMGSELASIKKLLVVAKQKIQEIPMHVRFGYTQKKFGSEYAVTGNLLTDYEKWVVATTQFIAKALDEIQSENFTFPELDSHLEFAEQTLAKLKRLEEDMLAFELAAQRELKTAA